MILSVDSRSYLLSKLKKKYSLSKEDLSYLFIKFLGAGSGPQEFITNLINEISKSRNIKVSFNFLNSDIHLLNAGFHSPLWKHINLKNSKRVIIRFDGVGIDNSEEPETTKKSLNKLLEKGEMTIFQSEFCRSFFKNEFGYLPKNVVIHNGSDKSLSLKNEDLNKLKEKINIPIEEEYFVVSGRYTGRKRIKDTIKSFSNFKKFNLVVLSNVPKDERIKSKGIKYLGLKEPNFANQIISNSKALIHMDQYDWCPNIVISALTNKVPVICSNYGGTCELVKENGIIVNEYPKDTPHNLEGIKFVRGSEFPDELLYEALMRMTNKKLNYPFSNRYDIKDCADKYIKAINEYLKYI